MSYRIRVENARKEYRLGTGLPLVGLQFTMGMASGAFRRGPGGDAGTVALDDVTFSVTEGERVGIIGENGAGKSTLLHLIAGVETPTGGTIEIEGRVHAALTIGLTLREDLSGRENLYLDAEVHGRRRSEVDAVIGAMIEFADLGAFIDRPVRSYSSGMKARLSFTSLVFVEPEILLIDEMLSVGDHWFAQKAARAVRELCAKGRIVLLVSHSLESIVAMCSRCLWLERGRLAADGDPIQVTSAYRERVRQRDEAEMAARVSVAGAPWTRDDTVRITGVMVGAASQRGLAPVLSVGEDVWVRVGLRITSVPPAHDVRLWIERLDGLRVTENRLSESGVLPALAGDVELVAELGSLMLGPGFYRIQIEFLSGERIEAKASAAFKVVADHLLTGGQPALRVPVYVSCRPRQEDV